MSFLQLIPPDPESDTPFTNPVKFLPNECHATAAVCFLATSEEPTPWSGASKNRTADTSRKGPKLSRTRLFQKLRSQRPKKDVSCSYTMQFLHRSDQDGSASSQSWVKTPIILTEPRFAALIARRRSKKTPQFSKPHSTETAHSNFEAETLRLPTALISCLSLALEACAAAVCSDAPPHFASDHPVFQPLMESASGLWQSRDRTELWTTRSLKSCREIAEVVLVKPKHVLPAIQVLECALAFCALTSVLSDQEPPGVVDVQAQGLNHHRILLQTRSGSRSAVLLQKTALLAKKNGCFVRFYRQGGRSFVEIGFGDSGVEVFLQSVFPTADVGSVSKGTMSESTNFSFTGSSTSHSSM
mmetsp:Transcript_4139/g.6413  ORF Transcript_4139/g.6413 Transcript_4139/m.6413 type:complete len:357 (+) Transcript_4139:76-1146(+)